MRRSIDDAIQMQAGSQAARQPGRQAGRQAGNRIGRRSAPLLLASLFLSLSLSLSLSSSLPLSPSLTFSNLPLAFLSRLSARSTSPPLRGALIRACARARAKVCQKPLCSDRKNGGIVCSLVNRALMAKVCEMIVNRDYIRRKQRRPSSARLIPRAVTSPPRARAAHTGRVGGGGPGGGGSVTRARSRSCVRVCGRDAFTHVCGKKRPGGRTDGRAAREDVDIFLRATRECRERHAFDWPRGEGEGEGGSAAGATAGCEQGVARGRERRGRWYAGTQRG